MPTDERARTSAGALAASVTAGSASRRSPCCPRRQLIRQLAVSAGRRARGGGRARRGRLAHGSGVHPERGDLPHAARGQLGAAGGARSAVAGPTAVRRRHRRGAAASAAGRRPSAAPDHRHALAARARRRLCARVRLLRRHAVRARSGSQDRRRVRHPAVPRLPRRAAGVQDSAQRRVLLGTLVALGAYLGLTVLFETLEARRARVSEVHPRRGLRHPSGAGRGPFVDAVANGLALYMCAVACAIAVASWRSRADARRSPWRSVSCASSAPSSAWSAPSGSARCSGRAWRCSRRAACAATSSISSSTVAVAVAARWRSFPASRSRCRSGPTSRERSGTARTSRERPSTWSRRGPCSGFGWSRFAARQRGLLRAVGRLSADRDQRGGAQHAAHLRGGPRPGRDDPLDRGRRLSGSAARWPRAGRRTCSHGAWACWRSRPRTSSS